MSKNTSMFQPKFSCFGANSPLPNEHSAETNSNFKMSFRAPKDNYNFMQPRLSVKISKNKTNQAEFPYQEPKKRSTITGQEIIPKAVSLRGALF